MQELQFEVLIDPDLESEVEGVVAFGDFKSPKETAIIYPADASALASFYRDLILGRPFPLSFRVRRLDSLGKLLAMALFLHRDLAIHSRMPSVVASVSFVDHMGIVGLAHVDPELSRFFKFLSSYLPSDLPKTKQMDRIKTVVEWIGEYVREDRLPSLPPKSPSPLVFDSGTDGFVLAENKRGSMDDGWEDLFRRGYLRGALFGPDKDGRRIVLAARKSPFLAFDLRKAAEILNEAERAMNEPPEWVTDGLWMEGPKDGTLLLVSAITQVLVRV